MKGTVKWYNEQKGYGFIAREDGEGDIFVHFTGIQGQGRGHKRLIEGQEVEFRTEDSPRGLKAVNVKVIG